MFLSHLYAFLNLLELDIIALCLLYLFRGYIFCGDQGLFLVLSLGIPSWQYSWDHVMPSLNLGWLHARQVHNHVSSSICIILGFTALYSIVFRDSHIVWLLFVHFHCCIALHFRADLFYEEHFDFHILEVAVSVATSFLVHFSCCIYIYIYMQLSGV